MTGAAQVTGQGESLRGHQHRELVLGVPSGLTLVALAGLPKGDCPLDLLPQLLRGLKGLKAVYRRGHDHGHQMCQVSFVFMSVT